MGNATLCLSIKLALNVIQTIIPRAILCITIHYALSERTTSSLENKTITHVSSWSIPMSDKTEINQVADLSSM